MSADHICLSLASSFVNDRGRPDASERCIPSRRESFSDVTLGKSPARTAECLLVEAVLAGCFLDQLPQSLIGDKAYDSDALDTQMSEYGVEMISPDRVNRKQKTQDGRSLRRY